VQAYALGVDSKELFFGEFGVFGGERDVELDERLALSARKVEELLKSRKQT
jgi:hypothetical protein